MMHVSSELQHHHALADRDVQSQSKRTCSDQKKKGNAINYVQQQLTRRYSTMYATKSPEKSFYQNVNTCNSESAAEHKP
jgi:hypothetical protein